MPKNVNFTQTQSDFRISVKQTNWKYIPALTAVYPSVIGQ